MDERISISEMIQQAGTTNVNLIHSALWSVTGSDPGFIYDDGYPRDAWATVLPGVIEHIAQHNTDAARGREASEHQQSDAVQDAVSVLRQRAYESALVRAGLPVPAPVVVTLRGNVRDGYVTTLTGPEVRDGVSLTGARFESHRAPSGIVYRRVWLYTNSPAIRPPFIDAVVNGVRILFDWNGHGRPALGTTEWRSVRALKESEADAIEAGGGA